MLVNFDSGKQIEVLENHYIFIPISDAREGTKIDPMTIKFKCSNAFESIKKGICIIVDDTIERISDFYFKKYLLN